MKLSEQLKKYRKSENLTQKELAQKLNVSDKTISSWETGRTYPDISLLINLSSILHISLDEFLKGDVTTVEKIDKDLKMKKVYKYWLIGVLISFLAGIGLGNFLSNYQYENQWVDRFNPLIKTEVGYAPLPENKTLKAGKPYKDIIVVDDEWGNSTLLDFYGGLHPKDKDYAMVQHKGLYVSRISFVSRDVIPKIYRNYMYKDYDEMAKAAKIMQKYGDGGAPGLDKHFALRNGDYE